MTSKHIFIGLICLGLVGVLAVFLIQPGRYQETEKISDSSRQLQLYLSDWGTVDKAAFADCMLAKSDDDRLTRQEAEECAKVIPLNQ